MGALKTILWMSWRQINAKKGKSLSFMTAMSIFGIAIGVCALVVVLSVMGGFEKDLKNRMFQGLPHMEIVHKNFAIGLSLTDYPTHLIYDLFPHNAGIEPFIQADVVLKKNKHLSSLALFGIDPALGGHLWGFSSGMVEGEIKDLLQDPKAVQDAPGIILSEALASQLGVLVGDEVRILSPQTAIDGPLLGGTFSARFKVAGLFMTDLPRFETKYGVVSLSSARKFMADYDRSLDDAEMVSGIAINMEDPEHVKKDLPEAFKANDLTMVTWKDVNQSLLFALKLEKFTMGAILLLIVLVAAFSISGTMMMMVYHKRRQIAILRSLGLSQKGVLRLFLSNGFMIGSIGVLCGLALGLLICYGLHWLYTSHISIGILHTQKLPVTFLPFEYAVICLCAWLLTLLSALYPAMMGARQEPGVGLRYM